MSAAKAKPTGLVFYPAAHRYRLSPAPGEPAVDYVPGVTTICGVIDKPGLLKWAAGTVAEFVADQPSLVDLMAEKGGRDPLLAFLKAIPFQRRDTAGARGTTFHDFAERIALGEEVEVPPEQVGMVESALAFMEDFDIHPVLVEEACASREHKWAGKLDLVADCAAPEWATTPADPIPFKGRAIWDWKSGKSVYASAAWQLNAYAHAEFHGEHGKEHPMADLGIEAAFGVHIRDDGYSVHRLRFGPAIYAEFLAIRAAFDANKRAEGNWKIPGTGYVGAPYVKEVVT